MLSSVLGLADLWDARPAMSMCHFSPRDEHGALSSEQGPGTLRVGRDEHAALLTSR